MSLTFNAQMKNVKEYHVHDVLCGRGAFINNHLGNHAFRHLAFLNKEKYSSCDMSGKVKLANILVHAIRNQNPPGRFLKQDPPTGLWHDIGNDKAIEKTRQLLRECQARSIKKLASKNKHKHILRPSSQDNNNIGISNKTGNMKLIPNSPKNFETKLKEKDLHNHTKNLQKGSCTMRLMDSFTPQIPTKLNSLLNSKSITPKAKIQKEKKYEKEDIFMHHLAAPLSCVSAELNQNISPVSTMAQQSSFSLNNQLTLKSYYSGNDEWLTSAENDDEEDIDNMIILTFAKNDFDNTSLRINQYKECGSNSLDNKTIFLQKHVSISKLREDFYAQKICFKNKIKQRSFKSLEKQASFSNQAA